ncbi:MAG: hypothetical protein ACI9V8_001863 [Urechidicola sp.]|jgi:hypothetical protein
MEPRQLYVAAIAMDYGFNHHGGVQEKEGLPDKKSTS